MKFAFLFLSCVLASNLFAQLKPTADLIISNAKVWTVDKAHPTAQAVAVLGDRIVAVGSNADVESWRSPATKVIDAGGKPL
jgi:predicted amidohydrolase YtcJ